MTADSITAEYREAPLAVKEENPLVTIVPHVSAEAMVAKLQEWERFKALAIREDAWQQIPGVQGKYLPAEEVDRIAPAIGISWEIISKNEFGDAGVRAVICEQLTYEMKTVTRKGKGGGTYDAQVPDHTKPVKTLAVLYTVTVRCRDAFGRCVEVEGSFSSLEMPKSDYHSRQQALTRARRVASMKLMGGVDHDVFEEERARMESEARALAARKIPSAGALFARARGMKLCEDGPTFRAWCAEVLLFEGAKDPLWQPNEEQREDLAKALTKFD